jgi:tetratricopeptide (TPR) repeat protein
MRLMRPCRVAPPARLAGFLLLLLAQCALAQSISSTLDAADSLDSTGQHESARDLLLQAIDSRPSAAVRAALHWRLARAELGLGDDLAKAGASNRELLGRFQQGEIYAGLAIADAPDSPLGYYWQAVNIGKWGQAKGMLDALGAVRRMQVLLQQVVELAPTFTAAYFVLGALYEQLPGFPLSFGDVDAAVSFGRMAISLREAELAAGLVEDVPAEYYTELAKHLRKRNWHEARRAREQSRKRERPVQEENNFDRAANFEATAALRPGSDRQEAALLLQRAIGLLRIRSHRTPGEERQLSAALRLQSRLQ